jgi:single-stranded DNA-binding protein
VEIIADSVQFLGGRGEGGGEGGERQFVPAAATAGNEDFAGSADDDIPF